MTTDVGGLPVDRKALKKRLGEASSQEGSVEDEIKAVFEQKRQKIRERFCDLDAFDLDTLQSGVLTVLRQHEATHKKTMETLGKACGGWISENIALKKDRETRNKQLQDYEENLKKDSPCALSFIGVWEEARNRTDAKQRDLAYQIAYDRGQLEAISFFRKELKT